MITQHLDTQKLTPEVVNGRLVYAQEVNQATSNEYSRNSSSELRVSIF